MTDEQINRARGCECLSRIEAQLNQQTKNTVELQLRACIITDPDAENWETFADLPPLSYKYREAKKVRTGHVKFSFCPFCGIKKQA